jgi:hypothetical protein
MHFASAQPGRDDDRGHATGRSVCVGRGELAAMAQPSEPTARNCRRDTMTVDLRLRAEAAVLSDLDASAD